MDRKHRPQKRAKGKGEYTMAIGQEERKILEESVFGIKSIFDLRHIYDDVVNDNETSFLDKEFHYLECGYMFMPYAFFKACENKLERAGHKFKSKHFYNFKIKEGETIWYGPCDPTQNIQMATFDKEGNPVASQKRSKPLQPSDTFGNNLVIYQYEVPEGVPQRCYQSDRQSCHYR